MPPLFEREILFLQRGGAGFDVPAVRVELGGHLIKRLSQ